MVKPMTFQRRTFLSAALIAIAAVSSAVTINLPTIKDTRLLTFSMGTNYGTDGIFSTYNAGPSNEQTSLLEFDLSSIPAGDVITGATLNLWGDQSFGTGVSTTNIYRTTNSWAEMQATWNVRETGVPWNTSGGDAVGTTGVANTNPYASWTGNQITQWYAFDITQLVSEWHTGTNTNYGLLMRGPVGNRLVYASKENAVVNNRPYLTVTHEAVPEPATLLVSGLALLALRRRRRSA